MRRMHRLNTADLYLARLAARPPYRWTIYIVFFITATASLYLRVVQGRPDQVLPWYGGVLAVYGFGMAAAASDMRCRVVYACFGLLIAAAFSRAWLTGWTRAVGVVEVASALTLLAAFASLSRQVGVGGKRAVLESDAPQNHDDQEDSGE